MEVIYSAKAQEDIAFWKKSGNNKIKDKITELIKNIENNPFEGQGKPEKLKHQLSGCWSRRINKEHRIVYEVISENCIHIHSLRGHY